MNILLYFAAAATLGCVQSCHPGPEEPVLAALIDLHSGEDCSIPRPSGFVKLAVLHAVVTEINDENNPISIALQVFDTCSSKRGSVAAAMHALVATLQTCLKSPLFIGFLGPENSVYLEAVKNLTASFNFSHIIPYDLDKEESNNVDTAFYMSHHPTIPYTRAIQMVASEVGIRAPLVLHEETPWATTISSELIFFGIPGALACQSIASRFFTNATSFEEALTNYNTHDGVIIIVETDEMVGYVSKILDAQSVEIPVIVSLLYSTPQYAYEWKSNHLLINQARSSGKKGNTSEANIIYDMYIKRFVRDSARICNKYKISGCSHEFLKESLIGGEHDWIIDTYRSAINAIGLSLASAYRLRCVSNDITCLYDLPQDEWQSILRNRGSTFLSPPHRYVVYTLNSSSFVKIGQIEDGGLEKSGVWPTAPSLAECPTVEATVRSVPPVTLMDVLLPPESAQLFQVIGTVIGACFGFLIIFIVLSMCVYKTFKVERSRVSSRSNYTAESRGSERS